MNHAIHGLLQFQWWHLPTLPLVTAVPSAVRGLTALCEMGEVFTRLNCTNQLTLSFHYSYP